MRRRVLITVGFLSILVLCAGTVVTAESREELWTRAVDHVQHRDYDDAAPLLEILRDRDPRDVQTIRMLATVYEMQGRQDAAEELMRSVVEDSRLEQEHRGRVAFDLGVFLSRHRRRQEAVEMYTMSLDYDSGLVPVYLNRANARVELGEYSPAIDDYERFLALRPSSSQRSSIEEMIALLTREVEAEEERRLEEERRAREEAEARRVAEEARREQEERERREAEERRQKMMDSVLESLGSAREDARGARGDREDIIDFDDDLELLD